MQICGGCTEHPSLEWPWILYHLLLGIGSVEIVQKDMCRVQVIDVKTKPHAYAKFNWTNSCRARHRLCTYDWRLHTCTLLVMYIKVPVRCHSTTSLSPLQWSETGMAQTRVVSLHNALMVSRNPPSNTGLRADGIGATLPPPGGFCGVTASWPVDMATRDETTTTSDRRDRRWQTNPVFLTQKWSNDQQKDQ